MAIPLDKSNVNLVILRETFKHMGTHSGYDLLCESLKKIDLNPAFVWLNPPWFAVLTIPLLRVLRKFGLIKSPWFKGHNLFAELELIHKSTKPRSIVHILYGESNLGLLSKKWIKRHRKLVVTIHQPMMWWQLRVNGLHTVFESLDALIVLSRVEQEKFTEFTRAPVHFVPHGIDTQFFAPASPELLQFKLEREKTSCIFVGQWLRDFNTLYEVMKIVSDQQLEIRFDVVVPKHTDMDTNVLVLLERIEAFPFVASHENLSDEQLLALYQQANLLVLPLKESTANNTILEALACGLPIVTTKTSGVMDYVDFKCAMVFEPGDANGIVEGILGLSANPETQKRMAIEARKRAIEQFSWTCIAQQMATIYQELDGPIPGANLNLKN